MGEQIKTVLQKSTFNLFSKSVIIGNETESSNQLRFHLLIIILAIYPISTRAIFAFCNLNKILKGIPFSFKPSNRGQSRKIVTKFIRAHFETQTQKGRADQCVKTLNSDSENNRLKLQARLGRVQRAQPHYKAQFKLEMM